jgi:hypothetical protein
MVQHENGKKKNRLSSKSTSSMKSPEKLKTHITINVHRNLCSVFCMLENTVLFQNLIWPDLGLSPENPVIPLRYQS